LEVETDLDLGSRNFTTLAEKHSI